MKFGKLVGLAVVWLGCGLAARAQFGAYIGYSATDFTGIQCLATVNSTCSNGVKVTSTTGSATGSVKPSGLMLGGYYDFRTYGPVRLGVDVRYMHDRANKSASDTGGGEGATDANTFLGGVRGTVKTPLTWLRPYAEVAFGRTSSDLTEPFCATVTNPTCVTPVNFNNPRKFDSFFRYEGFVGADIKIASMLDLRAIELGVGNMNRMGSGFNGSTSSVGMRSIGAGLVFHLPR